ncbi:BTAD domain-containing putative transcriptional regulator [Planomonospora venezuelensis]|uniref:Putative ATPase/DNA-binding SARP family transcriptional activator n=1 Tax=Planomonospora venezuelensis TaxID=1999 RepID=A0A841D474_PLAVE|nr:BTAD domain-containing putative transcriptional regulator [Planomonospora venezuelensis]MBB5963188.1 putative ATPase/DNA-binding SARP family transcriptional activator [Planomonospora venezuelensis]GIN00065.1 SARP family transcriptional regulator [Planomonospora venezuelensis]
MGGSATLWAEHAVGREEDHGAGDRPGAWAINVLGPMEAWRAGRAVVLPPRRRGLLALLALRAGGLVTAGQLVDGLWGEDAPPTAVRTLHAHIAKLGAALAESGGGRLIRRRDPGYVLDAGAVAVDRDRFEDLARSGLRHCAEGRYAEAVRSFGGGLALWRGRALSDCPVRDWAALEADYLEELRLQAYEGLFAARLATGAHDTVAGEIERLVAEHPLRERLWELLIVALQVSGRSGDALGRYRQARRTLVDELGVEPGEGLRHVEAGVLQGIAEPRRLLRLVPAAAPGAAGPLTLPQEISTLVGREADIERTRHLLDASRLVTLTGPGGCGKTRLAIAAARAAAGFAEVAFADLAAVHDEDGIADTIAAATLTHARPGARVLDQVAGRISCDRLLIVMDNCEHLAGACARIARELLTRCPQLKILATSQEALRLPGEAVHAVSGLGVPVPERVRTAADLAGHDAVVLLAERAGIGEIGALSPEDARAAAAICARCDGLPLAIELAAARARLLTLPEIARRLRDPYTILADGPGGSRPQHRALRATVEWSFHLLTAEERSALTRFSILGGAFTLETAAAVHPDAPILGTLSRLVDKSLLKALRTPSGTRYQLLETIRGYALEQLAARPAEHAWARRAHAAHYLRCAEEVESGLQGPGLGALMAEVAEHHEDLRAAMTWLIGDDPESALRLAAALWRYHYLRGRYGEGRDWLRAALAAAPPGTSPRVLAGAHWSAARLASLECDYREAEALARAAMELYEGEGDGPGVARSQALLGAICRELGDYRQAIGLSRRSLAAAERRGDTWAVGHTLQMLGFACWLSGDFAGAARFSGRAAELFGPIGDRERLAWCRLDLGAAALYTGRTETASRHLTQALQAFLEVRFKEGVAWAENLLALVDLGHGRRREALRRLATSLRLHHELGDRWRQAGVLDALARTVALLGDGGFAAELLGAAGHIRAAIATPVPSCERPAHAETEKLVRAMVGSAAYEEAYALGPHLDIEDVRRRIAAPLGPVPSGAR